MVSVVRTWQVANKVFSYALAARPGCGYAEKQTASLLTSAGLTGIFDIVGIQASAYVPLSPFQKRRGFFFSLQIGHTMFH